MKNIVQSVGIDRYPEYAVITNNEHGVGVFSWHLSKEDAVHNAKAVRGVVVPVDYSDGELIVPSLAKAYLKYE